MENVLIILKRQEFWKKIASHILSKAWSIDHSTTLQATLWNLYGRYTVVCTPIEILKYVQEMLAGEGVKPSQFKGSIAFMSMYNDINWW